MGHSAIKDMDMELEDFIGELATRQIGIASARLLPNGMGFHFEIVLDGLTDRCGSVAMADCVAFSRRFTAWLDQQMLEGIADSSGSLLPASLRPDNYTVEVSSAGVEREISLPEELDRFKGLPLQLHYRLEGQPQVALVLFRERQAEDGRFSFYYYQPCRSKGSKGPRQADYAEPARSGSGSPQRQQGQRRQAGAGKMGGDKMEADRTESDRAKSLLLLEGEALQRARLFFDPYFPYRSVE